MARSEDCFTVFGRIGVMPGKKGSEQKEERAVREKMRYVNSDLVHPCNPASFHVAQSDCLLLPVKVATGILMLA